jgi:PAS domain S-box-containing protein
MTHMNDEDKTQEQLMQELVRLRQRITELEVSEVERKQTEDALRESKSWLHTILTSAPITIFATDKQGVFTLSEGKGLEHVGLKPGENVGESALELFGEMPFVELTGAVISGQDIVRRALLGETVSTLNELHGVYFDNHIGPLRDPDGKVVGIVGVATDITKRKRAQEELRESEKKFSVAFGSSPEMISITNMKNGGYGVYIEVNDSFIRTTGYSREELIGRPVGEINMFVNPVDAEKMARLMREQGKIRNEEYSFRMKSGEIRDWLCSAELINIGGDSCSIAVATDITERQRADEIIKSSEEKFAKAFRASPNLMAITTIKEGKITDINEAFCRVLGYSPEECIGHTTLDLRIWMDQEQRKRLVREIKKRGYVHNVTIDLRTKSGEIITVIDSLDSITVKNDVYLLSVASDITERKRIDNELQKSQEELRSLAVHLQSVREEERTDIARGVHDDLGQALTALKMDLSWLSKRLPRERESLLEKTEAMSGILDSAIQTVKYISTELRPGILDDFGLLAAIEWQAEEFHKRSGIKCTVTSNTEPELNREYNTSLFRIFQETMTNIARHTGATRVTVNLKCQGGKIIMRIRDNGEGITPEQISSSRSFGIIGMRERARALQGEVNIRGIPGKGTTVTVTIPLVKNGEAQ